MWLLSVQIVFKARRLRDQKGNEDKRRKCLRPEPWGMLVLGMVELRS